jgi:cellulose synthase/poly-beta-1,6-N-acetylglucosamine synthase-like glycosyltransferase
MPLHAGTNRKRAVYNEMAIAFEKAGETSKDEFKRKIRMSRGILDTLFKNFGKYNVFKHGWFSYFYFGHRTLRYSLFLLHIIVFISNILIIRTSTFYCITMTCQVVFYLFALIGKSKIIKGKIFYYTYYYCMTITAQLIGAINQITGKSKPFWEKAESTR